MALGWNASARLSAGRIEAFAGVASHLRALGLSAPEVMATDFAASLALIEDIGPRTYARQIEDGADEHDLYRAAGEALAVVHRVPIPQQVRHGDRAWPIQTYDALALRAGVDLFAEWAPRLIAGMSMDDAARARWTEQREHLIATALTFPRALTLRDYHADNLIWMSHRRGVARVGLLDFQDAVAGWGEWDMDMLIHDARRDVSDEAAQSAIGAWLDGTGTSRAQFDTRIGVLGTLNALRVVGIFCRLIARDGKTQYRAFLPRQLRILDGLLSHRVRGNADMAAFVHDIAPGMFDAPGQNS